MWCGWHRDEQQKALVAMQQAGGQAQRALFLQLYHARMVDALGAALRGPLSASICADIDRAVHRALDSLYTDIGTHVALDVRLDSLPTDVLLYLAQFLGPRELHALMLCGSRTLTSVFRPFQWRELTLTDATVAGMAASLRPANAECVRTLYVVQNAMSFARNPDTQDPHFVEHFWRPLLAVCAQLSRVCTVVCELADMHHAAYVPHDALTTRMPSVGNVRGGAVPLAHALLVALHDLCPSVCTIELYTYEMEPLPTYFYELLPNLRRLVVDGRHNDERDATGYSLVALRSLNNVLAHGGLRELQLSHLSLNVPAVDTLVLQQLSASGRMRTPVALPRARPMPEPCSAVSPTSSRIERLTCDVDGESLAWIELLVAWMPALQSFELRVDHVSHFVACAVLDRVDVQQLRHLALASVDAVYPHHQLQDVFAVDVVSVALGPRRRAQWATSGALALPQLVHLTSLKLEQVPVPAAAMRELVALAPHVTELDVWSTHSDMFSLAGCLMPWQKLRRLSVSYEAWLPAHDLVQLMQACSQLVEVWFDCIQVDLLLACLEALEAWPPPHTTRQPVLLIVSGMAASRASHETVVETQQHAHVCRWFPFRFD